MTSPDDLDSARTAEKRAAAYLSLEGYWPALVGSVALWCAYLMLPHTAGLRGIDVIAGADGASLMEAVFAWAGTAAAVGTALVLATRLTMLAWVSWMLWGLSFFTSLWAVWALGSAAGAGYGFYLGLLGAVVGTVAFALVVFRKSPEQVAAEQRARAAAAQLDPVGQAQADATRAFDAAANPLLIDDRRAQAAARHRRAARDTDAEN